MFGVISILFKLIFLLVSISCYCTGLFTLAKPSWQEFRKDFTIMSIIGAILVPVALNFLVPLEAYHGRILLFCLLILSLLYQRRKMVKSFD